MVFFFSWTLILHLSQEIKIINQTLTGVRLFVWGGEDDLENLLLLHSFKLLMEFIYWNLNLMTNKILSAEFPYGVTMVIPNYNSALWVYTSIRSRHKSWHNICLPMLQILPLYTCGTPWYKIKSWIGIQCSWPRKIFTPWIQR